MATPDLPWIKLLYIFRDMSASRHGLVSMFQLLSMYGYVQREI